RMHLNKGKIAELDADEDITLVDVDAEVEMDANIHGRMADTKVSASMRRRSVVIQDPEETAASSVIMHSEVNSKDKGKGILIEKPKPLKGKAQIDIDEAFARHLEA
nr:hypothetical protein [Tanacetum cinerariifolium]